MAEAHPAPRSSMVAAFGSRNFRLWWISLLVSNSGTWLQSVAMEALIYQMTGRAVVLGLISVVRAITLISLAFVGGTIADRLDKRKLIIVTQTLFAALAVVLGVLAHTALLQIWHVVAVSMVSSVLLAFDQPARQALLPHLVPREHLMNAIALTSVTFTGAAAIGPALAGPVVRLLGYPSGFYLNAASFFAVIFAAWAIRLPAAAGPRPQQQKVGTAVAEGLRYIGGTPALLLLVSTLAVFSFFAIPYQSLLPVYAYVVFDGGVTEFGWLRAAPGLGALTGGFLLARFAGQIRKDWLVIGGGFGFAAALLLFAATPWLSPALVLLFGIGLLLTLFQSTIQTLMQQITSDEMRGRVMSLFAIAMIGMWPLGAGPMTWLSDRLGPATATALGAGVSAVALLALVLAHRPVLRQFRR